MGELTEEQTTDLARLREALGLSWTDAGLQAAQDKVVAPAYEKAVKEAVGGGAITEANLDGLVTLCERLGLSQSEADRIYAQEVRGALKELIAKAVEILEKDNEEGEGKKM